MLAGDQLVEGARAFHGVVAGAEVWLVPATRRQRVVGAGPVPIELDAVTVVARLASPLPFEFEARRRVAFDPASDGPIEPRLDAAAVVKTTDPGRARAVLGGRALADRLATYLERRAGLARVTHDHVRTRVTHRSAERIAVAARESAMLSVALSKAPR